MSKISALLYAQLKEILKNDDSRYDENRVVVHPSLCNNDIDKSNGGRDYKCS